MGLRTEAIHVARLPRVNSDVIAHAQTKRQFLLLSTRPHRQCCFLQFWRSIGLMLPKRLSASAARALRLFRDGRRDHAYLLVSPDLGRCRR